MYVCTQDTIMPDNVWTFYVNLPKESLRREKIEVQDDSDEGQQ